MHVVMRLKLSVFSKTSGIVLYEYNDTHGLSVQAPTLDFFKSALKRDTCSLRL